MRPLATNHRVLTWLCLCPADENTSKREKRNYILFAFTTFFFEMLGVAGSIAYFLTFMQTDLEKSLCSLFQIATYSGIIYVFIAMFVQRDKISAIFRKLSEIYDTNENNDSFQFLARANNKSELLWKMYFKFVVTGAPIGLFLMALSSVIFSWLFIGKLDSNYFAYPGKFIFPWNQKSIVGYFAMIFLNCAAADGYFICNGAFLLLFISLCVHHQAFYEMFRQQTRQLDCPDKNRNDEKLLGDLVDFHNSVKDLFSESAIVYSPIVIVQLISSMLLLTSAIFQLIRLEDFSRIDVIMPLLMAISAGISNLFVYCYLGKLATESFEKMADCLYEANWQDLPIRLQKHFVVMIANAERPIFYHGFNVAVLELRTFCAVLRATFSYFMMFRTITE